MRRPAAIVARFASRLSAARLWRWALYSLLALLLVVIAIVAAALRVAPAVNDLGSRVDRFAQIHRGQTLPLSADAPLLREAVVATEDERFYHHHGLDLIGLLRAIPYDLSHFSTAEGASTIPEQLAKIIYLGGRDNSPWRKAEDVALALRLSDRYSREQILAAYLDVVYFGQGRYGAAAASRHYFRREARDLDLAQASLLAGLLQAPSVYDPAREPAAARQRQVEVLRSMVRNGYATSSGAAAVLARPLQLATGTVLPAIGRVPLTSGAPFDWGELTLALFLLTLAIGAAQLATRMGTAAVEWPRMWPRLLRLGVVPLLLGGLFVAAHSIQVI